MGGKANGLGSFGRLPGMQIGGGFRPFDPRNNGDRGNEGGGAPGLGGPLPPYQGGSSLNPGMMPPQMGNPGAGFDPGMPGRGQPTPDPYGNGFGEQTNWMPPGRGQPGIEPGTGGMRPSRLGFRPTPFGRGR